ncbi:TlpA family protein disulfide reductase [Salinispora mooreana]|uniref:TlpA family protein disulfide reductase n=1 Tax=Salinispora mooreana TaxID=999545 RepID=UPI001CC608E7
MRVHIRNTSRAAVTLLFLLAASAGCSSKPPPAVEVAGGVPLVSAQSRVAAPSFSGEGLDGDHISYQDYKGHVIVLNFWASWCAPCRLDGSCQVKLRRLVPAGLAC